MAEPSLLEEPRVLDRDAGRRGQGLDELLVVVGEGIGRRPGQVEVAVRLLAHANRYAEERAHGRVTVREPDRTLVLGDVVDPDRLLLLDDQPEQTEPLRQVPDRTDGVVVHADVDELLEDTVRADDAQRAVVGTHQLQGGLDDAP